MADPKSGYFIYNGKVYERAYRPLDKAWTVMDDSGKGLDYGTNKSIYDAANVATDIYEDINSARQAGANAMRARGFAIGENGNWVKDGLEYDSNGKLITASPEEGARISNAIKSSTSSANPSDILNPLTTAGLNTALKISQLPSEANRRGLFTGNLSSYRARKNWVQEHKDYLKEKGAGINWDNYSGTAEQNLALKRLLGGYDAWNQSKVAKEERARTAKAQPTTAQAEKWVREEYNSGRPWQDAELLNMDGDAALYLNKEDYGRWIGLQTGHRQARPYVAASNIQTAGAPYARTNPYLAAIPISEVVSNPITQEMKFKMNPLGYTYRPPIKRTGGKVNYYNFFK